MRGENVGLFEKIFGQKKEQTARADAFFKTLTAYTPVFTNWNGKIYESERVRAAIDARARHFSKLNVNVHGSAKPVLLNRLKREPNEFQTWSQFFKRLETILCVNGTTYIVPVIDEYGSTTGIFSLLPQRAELVEYQNIPYIRYTFVTGQTASIELSKCGIVTRFQYTDDFRGEANEALRQTMQLINIQNQGIEEAVKNAATYRFLAKVTNFSKSEDLKKEQERFSRLNFSSEASAGGILLFPNTYTDINQIKTSPYTVDAEQMKIIDKNIQNYFGVNEEILQSKATPDQLSAFYAGSIEPDAIQLAEVLTKMLFSEREQASGAYISIAADRLQYMSVKDKLELLRTMGDRGMLRINEGRRLLDYDDVEGGDAMMPIRGEYYNAAEGKEGGNGNDESGSSSE